MKKQHLIIIIVASLITVIVLMTVYLISVQRAPENPAGTVGNTAGNLNNSGMFCEYNGKVYFSNSFDGGSLYVMNSDESGIEKLNNLKVSNLLAGGKYIYFYQKGIASKGEFAGLDAALPGVKSFVRCTLNGQQTTALTRDYVYLAQLVNNHLYMLTNADNAISFYKTDGNGQNKILLADYNINPSCAHNGIIYYNGTGNNHYLYALDTNTDVATELWAGNLWYPSIEGDYVYYLDVAHNYRLCRYSLSQKIVEILTAERVDCYNVGNGYIYYQKNSATNPQLLCMRSDGSSRQVVAEGNYTNINMTSHFVYFQEFGDDHTLYHSPLGVPSHELFAEAKGAVAE